jgi:AcrR family transcriptional regulator
MNKRPYTMRARAESARVTYRRILDAAEALFVERWYDEVTLEQVAEQAGVSKQTVLRRLGSKEALFAAVADELAERQTARLAKVPAGDLAKAAAALAAEYERSGLTTMRLVALEHRFPALTPVLEQGRERRRTWIEQTLAGLLPARSSKDYSRRLAVVMDVTSASTWGMLRLEARLSRKETERALHELLVALQRMRG